MIVNWVTNSNSCGTFCRIRLIWRGSQSSVARYFAFITVILSCQLVTYTDTLCCCQKFSKRSKRGKGKASSKTSSQCQDALHFNCWKLKYTEIIYKHSENIGPLVNVLLDVSDRLPKNTIMLTKVEATV
jgi:hypothetical protein